MELFLYNTTARERGFLRHELLKTLIHNYIMFIKFSFKGEHLWLRVSSVNNETVVGRVWSVPFIPGLLYGQMIQIPDILIYY